MGFDLTEAPEEPSTIHEAISWMRRQMELDDEAARAAIEAEFMADGAWEVIGPYPPEPSPYSLMRNPPREAYLYGLRSTAHETIVDDLTQPLAAYLEAHDPRSALVDLQAKRSALRQAEDILSSLSWLAAGDVTADDPVVASSIYNARMLASAVRTLILTLVSSYAGRPDYDSQWAPIPPPVEAPTPDTESPER
jgi:hypothetical protein